MNECSTQIPPTKEDFVRGRTFGIRGNMRKAIILDQIGDKVVWTWVGTNNDAGCSYISDVIDVCNWFGNVETHLLESEDEDEQQ